MLTTQTVPVELQRLVLLGELYLVQTEFCNRGDSYTAQMDEVWEWLRHYHVFTADVYYEVEFQGADYVQQQLDRVEMFLKNHPADTVFYSLENVFRDLWTTEKWWFTSGQRAMLFKLTFAGK